MRTTIDLPNDLYERAKMEAVKRRVTLRQLMVQGLNTALSQAPVSRVEPSRSESLLEVLQTTNNDKVNPLSRDEIYDR